MLTAFTVRRAHLAYNIDCWCLPSIIWVGSGCIVMHRREDRRNIDV